MSKRPGDFRRPSAGKFSWERAERVCERLEEGRPLSAICRDDKDIDVSASTVRNWVTKNYGVGDEFARKDFPGGFAQMFRLSFEVGVLALSDEMREIADDGSNDWMERNGHRVVDNEAIKRSELRVKTIQWYLSKMLPRIFGDKIEINHEHNFRELPMDELIEQMRRTALEAGVEPAALLRELGVGQKLINGSQ